MRALFFLTGLVAAWVAFKLWLRRGRVRPRRARELVDGGALLVDVRTPQEYERGHIAGARNMPLPRLTQDIEALGERDRAIVVYCQSGLRSRLAAARLREAGFGSVHDLGPRSAWPG
ncbi:MAG: rhodanese-like domain-containing protein [Nannocystaceae bacterium]